MNRRQKIVQEQFLNNEEAVIKRLKQVYNQSLKDIEAKAKALQDDINRLDTLVKLEEDEGEKARLLSMQQSKVYQKQYQDALKKQVGSILDNMQVEEFRTVSEYLQKCYEDGFIGTMYDLQGQGIPLCFPLDQEAMVRAVQLDSKISEGLYSRLGEDVALLKKKITAQVSRGISTGMSFQQVAQQLAGYTNIGYNNAVRIARTEGHRIQVQSTMDACYKAKDKGADVVKQWDSTLDARTRDSHQSVDGEIRELDKPFSNGLMFPGDPSGAAAEVVNCRCALLQRAKWALDEDELQTLKDRAAYYGLDKSQSFEDYKKTYLKAAEQVQREESKLKFIPAKTIEEAREYAKRFADDVDFGKLSVKACNSINETLDRLTAKYGVKVSKLSTYSKGTGAAHASYRHIEFKPGYFNKPKSLLTDYETIKAENKRAIESAKETIRTRNPGKQFVEKMNKYIATLEKKNQYGRFGVVDSYPDNPVGVTTTHEFGHYLADIFCGQINGEKAWKDSGKMSYPLVAQPKQQAIRKAFEKAATDGDIYKISAYSATNQHEFFAETFTMREMGEPLPDYIKEMLEEVLR